MGWFSFRTAPAAGGESSPLGRRPIDRKEIVAKARGLQLRARHDVTELLSGQYTSVFKGRGMEFEEVREYVPGDDVRSIDWNVTARMGHPYVKEFREERELTVVVMVDVSGSQLFGTEDSLRMDVAASIAGTLAFAAIHNNDKVGLILFSDRIERYVPPRKTRGHVWRVISEILAHKPVPRETRLDEALAFLSRVVRKKAVVFLLSDFLAEGFERPLRIARQRHDVTVIPIVDRRELELPPVGLAEFEDAETGAVELFDLDEAFCREFEALGTARGSSLGQMLSRGGVDRIPATTDAGFDFRKALLQYFHARERRFR